MLWCSQFFPTSLNDRHHHHQLHRSPNRRRPKRPPRGHGSEGLARFLPATAHTSNKATPSSVVVSAVSGGNHTKRQTVLARSAADELNESRSDGSESLFCEERHRCCVWMDAEAAKLFAPFPLRRSDRLCDIPRRWKRKRLREESERPVQRVNGPWSP